MYIKILLPYLNQEDCLKSKLHAKNMHQTAPLTTSKCKKLSLTRNKVVRDPLQVHMPLDKAFYSQLSLSTQV